MSLLPKASGAFSQCSLSKRALHVLPRFSLDLSKPIAPASSDHVFLSAEKLKTLALTYQQGVLDRLNQQVKGTNFESLRVLDTVLKSSADPALALTFNYASTALNNAFFLNGLKQAGTPPPESILPLLIKSFGSYHLFQQTLFHTISDLKTSSAWIWLVQEVNTDGSLNRLTFKVSYGAGSILVPSRLQDGSPRPLPPIPSSSSNNKKQTPSPSSGKNNRLWEADRSTTTTVPSSDQFSVLPPAAKPTGPIRTYPLAVLSVHERTFLPSPLSTTTSADFSTQAKETFASGWLNSLDWAKVEGRLATDKRMVSEAEKADILRWMEIGWARVERVQRERDGRSFDSAAFQGWFEGWETALEDAERAFGVVQTEE